MLVNDQWMYCFPNVEAEALGWGVSDHCPLLINLVILFVVGANRLNSLILG